MNTHEYINVKKKEKKLMLSMFSNNLDPINITIWMVFCYRQATKLI